MPDDTEATAIRARLEAIVKEAKDAEAQAAAARHRVQAARLLLEDSKATALEQTATTARQRVPSSSSSSSSPAAASQLVPTASSTYEDTVVAGLHLQMPAVLNVRQLVNIILNSSSTNYANWRDLMDKALQRYALIKHVTDDTPSNDPGWIRLDSVILNWISNSISADLHQVVRERGCTARHLCLTIENQFLGNRKQRTLHLDTAFHIFVQGDLSVLEYCRKFKTMADGLANLGSPVEDRILVLNILQGLNQRFEHVSSIIRHYSPFPTFLKVQDDLLLEEIHMDSTDHSATPTALYTNDAPPTARPPSSTPSRPPNGGNNGNNGHRNKNNKNRNGGHGGGNNGRNSNGSDDRNGSSGQTTVPTASDGRTGTPWPTYGHPWQGHMTVYPDSVPTGQQCPQAFMATPGPYSSPGFLPGQQQALYQQAAPAPSPGWNPWVGAGWDQQWLAHSFNTMVLHPPPTSVQDWVADSGATHHTTPSVGNISTPRPLNSSYPSSIIISNGSSLSVTSVGDSVLPGPFYLNNILLGLSLFTVPTINMSFVMHVS
jgi:hypothetical protein